MISEEELRSIAASCPDSRTDLWELFIDVIGARHVAEIGVLRGRFAASILGHCQSIHRYYMVDPWRHLENWHKPANASDQEFDRIFAEAMERTDAWKKKRVVLRGKTTEVIGRIADEELDFAYVDADHTLCGITIDLIRCYDKVRAGGWIGGDDFCPSIWQHPPSYEPTLVFPFAVYFAEAVSQRIFALPHNQFLIEKQPEGSFEFCDLTGAYPESDLRGQLMAQGDPNRDSELP